MPSKSPSPAESAKQFVRRVIRRAGRSLGVMLAVALLGAGGAAHAADRTLVFFGDSLTAGYGVDPSEAFPALIQQKLDAAGGGWRAVNAGLSGETTSGGLRRLDWVLKQKIDVFVLELGGNDGLRGIPLELTRANLQAMIDKLRTAQPRTTVVLVGMQMPTNLGPDYTQAFARIFPELAEKNHLPLVPFLLEGVGGVPELNQADGIHPTPEGHRIVAENVWKILAPLTR